jgi:RNA polymerase sigma-70 factor (ECF subfamily)
MTEAVGFEAFFRAEHPKLVALGLTMVGDGDAARELAQEALVRACRNWSRVSGFDIPGAWVRRVLINLVADRGRRLASEARALERLQVVGTYESPEPVDATWRAAVLALPERQRAVVALHYLEDASVDTVAVVLGIAPGTVKATLASAKRNLRRALDQEARS